MKHPGRLTSFLVATGLAFAVGSPSLGSTRASGLVASAATEAAITRATAQLLERAQLAHRPLDDDLAGRFLARYLDDLDGSRSLFLQADVNDFSVYRSSLVDATRTLGDTRGAHAIFARYLQRLSQQVAYTSELLRTERFDFSGHDVYSFDREHAERPRDLKSAQLLWRQQLRAEYLQAKLAGKKRKDIVRTLLRRRQQQLATMKALDSSEILEIYLNALAHVYDPHSDYLGREAMDSLNIAMKLSLFGIGASLESKDGYCRIRELIPGGPAARSGLVKAGDRILAVAQAQGDPVDITNLPLARAVQLIRGPKDSIVKLTLLPVGEPEGSPTEVVPLRRDQIHLDDQRAKATIMDLPVTTGGTVRVGVVVLPSFYVDLDRRKNEPTHGATADVAALLRKLNAEHVRGIVLDLRNNGGGSLDEAIRLTGLFIRKGPVVQTRNPAGDIEVGVDPDPTVEYYGPLVVLINRFSASASEILAGALKDYGRAVIVGDSSTFGKGTVQDIVPLRSVLDNGGVAQAYDPGALKVSISKFYLPDGASTQLRGVASDIILPSPSDLGVVGESALKNPLPWNAVPPAPHDQLNLVKPYLDALRARSARRCKSEKGLIALANEAARLRRSVAEKSVSLNEAARRREMARDKAEEKQRKQNERLHPVPVPTIYEITPKNASLPGLPPPKTPEPEAAADEPASPLQSSDGVGEVPAERSPADDRILRETTRILLDYIDLLGSRRPATDPSGPRATARAAERTL